MGISTGMGGSQSSGFQFVAHNCITWPIFLREKNTDSECLKNVCFMCHM